MSNNTKVFKVVLNSGWLKCASSLVNLHIHLTSFWKALSCIARLGLGRVSLSGAAKGEKSGMSIELNPSDVSASATLLWNMQDFP